MRVLRNGCFAVRAALALVLANVRYWRTVAPVVRVEMARWERRARTIEDPELRELALAKLDAERFNAEAAAMLATLAPSAWRADVVRATVAFELLFDLLDGLSERPCEDPLADGERLFAVFTNALAFPVAERAGSPGEGQDGYLQELAGAGASAIARLPGTPAVIELARASAARAAQAQIRMHAVARLGVEQAQTWACAEAGDTGLQWREFLVGAASSVLVIHALIAAAAHPRTSTQHAAQIASTYLLICVLVTLLDGVVDHDEDAQRVEPGYVDLYADRELLSGALLTCAHDAAMAARELPNGPHHVMTLTGVAAYYLSSPGASGELARPIASRLRRELQPLYGPTFAMMRAWRLARQLHAHRRANGASSIDAG